MTLEIFRNRRYFKFCPVESFHITSKVVQNLAFWLFFCYLPRSFRERYERQSSLDSWLVLVGITYCSFLSPADVLAFAIPWSVLLWSLNQWASHPSLSVVRLQVLRAQVRTIIPPTSMCVNFLPDRMQALRSCISGATHSLLFCEGRRYPV